MTSKLTITREQATDKEIQMLIDSHENGTAMFLRVDAYYLMAKELQERRKAELDSKPVAWTDEEELRDANAGACGYLFGIDREANKFADPQRQIMLYRHAQPAPVVQENSDPRDAFEAAFPMPKHAQRCGDGYAVTSYSAWTAYEFVKKWEGWNACRAAMLQELKKSAGTEAICRSDENVQAVEVQSLTSINPAPDLVSLQKKAESIIGNYPGIPDGYVMVPKEPTEAMMLHKSGCQHHAWDDPDCAMRQTRQLVWSLMIAAATQEVK